MMFIATIASFLLIAPAMGSNSAALRRSLAIEDDWNVGTPSLTYNDANRQFTFSISHGKGVATSVAPILRVHGNTAGPSATSPQNACPSWLTDNSDTNEGVAGAIPFFSNELTTYFTGAGPYTSTWTFSLDGDIADDTNIFLDPHPTFAEDSLVAFCIYFGLQDNTQTPAQVVSFREIATAIRINMEGGFNILNVNTRAVDPGTSAETATFQVAASICPEGVPPFSQLTQVPVCICPAVGDTLTKVTGIDALTFTYSTFSQNAVAGGAPTGPTVSAIDCTYAPNCCKVGTMLNALFFPNAQETAVLSVAGTANLEINNVRHLVQIDTSALSRDLAEEAKGTFEMGVPVVGAEEVASSAYSLSTRRIAATAVGAVAAILL
jgi:hypothetical protein